MQSVQLVALVGVGAIMRMLWDNVCRQTAIYVGQPLHLLDTDQYVYLENQVAYFQTFSSYSFYIVPACAPGSSLGMLLVISRWSSSAIFMSDLLTGNFEARKFEC